MASRCLALGEPTHLNSHVGGGGLSNAIAYKTIFVAQENAQHCFSASSSSTCLHLKVIMRKCQKHSC
jgi:hypothetical protein